MGVGRLLAVIASVALVAGCKGKQAAPAGGATGAEGGGKPITIGFSLDTLKEERWQRDRDLFVAKAEELGARVLVQAANGDDALQNSQAENLLTQGVDVLRSEERRVGKERRKGWVEVHTQKDTSIERAQN